MPKQDRCPWDDDHWHGLVLLRYLKISSDTSDSFCTSGSSAICLSLMLYVMSHGVYLYLMLYVCV
ncbi:hypothetical protein D3C74_26800 [compost metagenome]